MREIDFLVPCVDFVCCELCWAFFVQRKTILRFGDGIDSRCYAHSNVRSNVNNANGNRQGSGVDHVNQNRILQGVSIRS